VFSTTLTSVGPNARVVRGDVGAVLDDLRREHQGDIGVAGANIAGQYVTRGLVDEFRLMVHPVVLGAGTPFWPVLDRPLNLRLVDRREFSSGVELRSYVPADH
jgi:dihydrofolate reductase